jgi:hypothetical protein
VNFPRKPPYDIEAEKSENLRIEKSNSQIRKWHLVGDRKESSMMTLDEIVKAIQEEEIFYVGVNEGTFDYKILKCKALKLSVKPGDTCIELNHDNQIIYTSPERVFGNNVDALWEIRRLIKAESEGIAKKAAEKIREVDNAIDGCPEVSNV